MKSNSIQVYMLAFSYAIFSFAVYIPSQKMDIYDWLKVFILGTAVGVFAIILTYSKKSVSTWVEVILLFYFIFLLSSKIYAVWRYTKLYHNRETADSIMIVTLIMILIFVAYHNIEIKKFATPLFIFSAMIIVLAILLNWGKISRYNIYAYTKNTQSATRYRVTMFDYIIPAVWLGNKLNFDNRKNIILFFVSINIILLLVTLFSFGCFRGDYMYSISPLQAVFQLSSTESIRNFDGVFYFLLIFAYFGAILLI